MRREAYSGEINDVKMKAAGEAAALKRLLIVRVVVMVVMRMVVVMMIPVIMMMMVPVVRCGWDGAAGRDCANNT